MLTRHYHPEINRACIYLEQEFGVLAPLLLPKHLLNHDQ